MTDPIDCLHKTVYQREYSDVLDREMNSIGTDVFEYCQDCHTWNKQQ